MDVIMNEIYEHERAKWINAAGRRKSFLARFTSALPFLIIIIQVAMFLVSAKHTSDMINLVAPGMGWAGVVGFELGLVIFSLMIYQTRRTTGTVAILWRILEWIMVIMIVLSNIAGSIDAIVSTTGIKELSFAAVIQSFGGLSLPTQTGLIVGLVFAVGVPLLFIGTGQAFAHLILSQSDGADPMEAQWLAHGYPYIYRAFFAHFASQGMRPVEAKQAAKQMAAGYFGSPQRAPALPEPSVLALPEPGIASAVEVSGMSGKSGISGKWNGNSTGSNGNGNGLSGNSTLVSGRDEDGLQRAMEAYGRGMKPMEVIKSGIAKKSTAYNAWNKYRESRGSSQ